eukprot:5824254-Amphidinium_carterae.1
MMYEKCMIDIKALAIALASHTARSILIGMPCFSAASPAAALPHAKLKNRRLSAAFQDDPFTQLTERVMASAAYGVGTKAPTNRTSAMGAGARPARDRAGFTCHSYSASVQAPHPSCARPYHQRFKATACSGARGTCLTAGKSSM